MKHIAGLFGKIESLIKNKTSAKKAVSDGIFDILKIKIPVDNIVCKNNIITINTRSVIKNEILLQKQKILAHLKQKMNHEFIDLR